MDEVLTFKRLNVVLNNIGKIPIYHNFRQYHEVKIPKQRLVAYQNFTHEPDWTQKQLID
ncbi:hypothetical protein Zm00014a_040950 [Zea mays]|jgi:hypothetical protein|uniref:Uncharacterized protein n=1 Tax=Zea mays TaxID=4577 RepID=A0A3L6EDK8_MAIZE|nr:hypothetical protein Zm00014a_040950 [Zea mays]